MSQNFTNEFKYYILLYGVFNQERNIIKNWAKYEDMFIKLVESDGKMGRQHLMQCIVLYFIRRYPNYGVYAGTFCKVLYDNEVFEESFFINWYNRKIKLDKNSAMYDRKAEKSFKEHIS